MSGWTMDAGMLLLQTTVGVTLAAHVAQKLFGGSAAEDWRE